METIWKFETARFTIVCECMPETEPDISWADQETLDNLESGLYVNCCFAVRVILDDREITAEYLGNSVYENVLDFVTAHRNGERGHYFPDMVREAISTARATLRDAPIVRNI